MATTPSVPVHRTRDPASMATGFDPNAKRDLAMSYEAPVRDCPGAHDSLAPTAESADVAGLPWPLQPRSVEAIAPRIHGPRASRSAGGSPLEARNAPR